MTGRGAGHRRTNTDTFIHRQVLGRQDLFVEACERDRIVTIFWTTRSCLINLATAFANGRAKDKPDLLPTMDMVVYVILFLGLGLLTMLSPFLWFRCFKENFKKCESMVHLSAADHAVMVDAPHDDDALLKRDDQKPVDSQTSEKRGLLTSAGRHSFRVFVIVYISKLFSPACLVNKLYYIDGCSCFRRYLCTFDS
jgi:hypothetical protein